MVRGASTRHIIESGRLPVAAKRTDPAGASDEFAFAATGDRPVVMQQVQNAQQLFGLEQTRHRCAKIDQPLADRTESERGGMEVSGAVGTNRPDLPTIGLCPTIASGDADGQSHAMWKRGLTGERETRAHAWMRKKTRLLDSFNRRSAKRRADQPGRFRHDDNSECIAARGFEASSEQP